MNLMNITIISVVLAVSTVYILALICGVNLKKTIFGHNGEDPQGKYFAEVYLTWYFGEGSILWRKRFNSLEKANIAMRDQAKYLDSILPKYYMAEYSSGKRYKEPHEFGISFRAGNCESRSASGLSPLNLTTLPGTEYGSTKLSDYDFSDEIRLSGSLAGFEATGIKL